MTWYAIEHNNYITFICKRDVINYACVKGLKFKGINAIKLQQLLDDGVIGKADYDACLKILRVEGISYFNGDVYALKLKKALDGSEKRTLRRFLDIFLDEGFSQSLRYFSHNAPNFHFLGSKQLNYKLL